MVYPIVIYGPPGRGKTTGFFPVPMYGIKGLPLEQLFFINCAGTGKDLPLRGKQVVSFDHNKEVTKPEAHMFTAVNMEAAQKALSLVIKHRPDINYIVVDDLGLGASRRVLELEKVGWEDWHPIAAKLQAVIQEAALSLSVDRTVFVFMVFHSEESAAGTKVQLPGNMLDKYVGGVIGQVVTALYATIIPNPEDPDGVPLYRFRTNGTATVQARSLPGMFEPLIPNDAFKIVENYCDYKAIDVP